MTTQVSLGTWTQVTGWGTALASVADAGNTTSGAINLSSAPPFAVDIGMEFDLDAAGDGGPISVYMLASVDAGTGYETTDHARHIATLTSNGTTQVTKVVRVYDVPDYFKIYVENEGGSGLDTASDVTYRTVNVTDV